MSKTKESEMNKYIFIQEFTDEYDQVSEVRHTFYADTHSEVADRFNEFLRGAGFHFNQDESYQLTSEDNTDTDWFEDEFFEEEQEDVSFDDRIWSQSMDNMKYQVNPDANLSDTHIYIAPDALDHSSAASWPFPMSRPGDEKKSA
jgi:hypothetical protein